MIEHAGDEFLNADEAAELLSVKKATLYAYVSRGRLQRYRPGVGRQSLYRRADLEALARLQTPDDASDEIPPATSWVRER